VASAAALARSTYVILLVADVAVGLAVHFHGFGLTTDTRDILGDALWAAMIFWIASLAAPSTAIIARVVVALAVCFAVELSQQIQHPTLAAIRATSLGHLVIGSDFDARDLLAYTGGITAAALLTRLLYGSKYLTGTPATPTLPS
jgi:hypothetical protein